MISLDPITLTTSPATLNIPKRPTVDVIQFLNESPYAIRVLFGGSGKSNWIPGWGERDYPVKDYAVNGLVTLQPTIIQSNPNPPSTTVLVNYYEPGEEVVRTVPYSRQVASNVTASSSYNLLAPDNLATWTADDTDLAGFLGLFPSQAPVPTGLLDIWLAARLNASQVQPLLESDVANLRVNFKVKVGFELNSGINFYIAGIQIVSGTGPGTFNHSLGTTPQIIILTPTQAAEAWFVGSYTATQFTVGGISAGHAWKALVIA